MILYRAHNGYDVKEASDEAAAFSEFPGDSLTVQSQAEDADINVIMARFGVTGRMPENPRIPQYGDFENVLDYRSALDAVRRADAGFAELPAATRAYFQNDPQNLLQFVSDARNVDEARRLGLLKESVHDQFGNGAGGVGASVGIAAGGGGGPSGASVGVQSAAVAGGGSFVGAGVSAVAGSPSGG